MHFLVCHFYRHFLQVFKREFLSLNSLVVRLVSSFLSSPHHTGFAFLKIVDCVLKLFCRYFCNSCRLFGIVVVHVCVAIVVILIHFLLRVVFLVVLIKSFLELTKDVSNCFSRCDAFPFIVFSFLRWVLSSLTVIFRTPLNSSRTLWMSCCLLILYFSLMHFVNAFAQILQSLFFSSPQWVSGFQYLRSGNLRSLLLQQMPSRTIPCFRSWTQSRCCWNGKR